LAVREVPGSIDAASLAVIDDIYRDVSTGRVFNEYPASFGAFVWKRVTGAHGSASFATTAPAPASFGPSIATPAAAAIREPDDMPIRRDFAEAQISRIVATNGDRDSKAAFARIASKDSVSVLGRAALAFSLRP
jgi:hypothetical protein